VLAPHTFRAVMKKESFEVVDWLSRCDDEHSVHVCLIECVCAIVCCGREARGVMENVMLCVCVAYKSLKYTHKKKNPPAPLTVVFCRELKTIERRVAT
jgi:hypothetical protein